MQSPTQNSVVVAEARIESGVDVSREEAKFLGDLGARVRELRERRGMSRKALARESQVSERYLAQIETGNGNISVLLLRRVAAPLGVDVAELLIPERQGTVERRLIRRFLERLPGQRLEEVMFRLMRDFGHEDGARRKRIALIGLRGAGKSTLGAMLAKELGVPLVELNREVARETGLPVSEVIALYGLPAYRRIELRVLERVAREQRQALTERRRTMTFDVLKEEARARASDGDYERAAALWRQVIDRQPAADPVVYRELAEAYRRLGRAEDAAQAAAMYQKALQSLNQGGAR